MDEKGNGKREYPQVVERYLTRRDWYVRENANMTYSVQGLNNYISSQVIKEFWLERVYPESAANAHRDGFFHIHDLGFLGPYCVGWDLEDLLRVGFRGVPGKLASKPAKHFDTALSHVVNFLYTLQGEAAGAQALSSFDVYLAPFVHYDGLSYREVKQCIQRFVFHMNVPTRVGFQTPFTNLTLDLHVPEHMRDRPVIWNGEEQRDTYGDFEDEVEMINRALVEVFTEGDADGRVFTFPIPTYNITDSTDWNSDTVWDIMEMTSKYGIPYFANFVGSDMDPSDVRSMCCRLRLDTRELKRRGGGLFGANPLTGSIGVVTVNMPRLGYLSKGDEDRFFEMLDALLDTAKEALEAKRQFLERMTEEGLYPYSKFYLRRVKERFGAYWAGHFNTIGLIGMNEACLNMFGVGIWDRDAKKFAERTLDHMLERCLEFQRETGHFYNLEATPAEGVSYRLAKIDREKYRGIITAGEREPFYTNSTWLPVDYTDDLFFVLEHQESLQRRYTGGTVLHVFLGEPPAPEATRKLLRTMTGRYAIPYYSITPSFSVCPVHGYIPGAHRYCPYPHTEEELVRAGLLRPGPSPGFAV